VSRNNTIFRRKVHNFMKKDEILSFLRERTIQFIKDDKLDNNGVDALEVSQTMKMDRANASKMLNLLWKDGKLIKIMGRPIYFLDWGTIVRYYHLSYLPTTISNNEVVTNYIHNEKENFVQGDVFDEYIGQDGSLKLVIDQLKSAIAYPKRGLPCLFLGENGVGKFMLASYMLEYGKQKGLKRQNSKIIKVRCANYINSASEFLFQLFGTKESKGLIKQCNSGILYFENIDHLNKECMEILYSLLETGEFLDSNNMLYKSNVTIVASCNIQNIHNYEYFKSLFPIIVRIPKFNERPLYERIEIVLQEIQKEAKIAEKNIIFTKEILLLLSVYQYKDNLHSLRKEIKIALSKAVLQQMNNFSQQSLIIHLYELSQNLLSSNFNNQKEIGRGVSILSQYQADTIIVHSEGRNELLDLMRKAPKKNLIYRTNQLIKKIENNSNNADLIRNIEDNIIYIKNCSKEQIQIIYHSVNPLVTQIVSETLDEDMELKLVQNHQNLILGLLLHITNMIKTPNEEIELKYNTENQDESITKHITNQLNTIFKHYFSQSEFEYISLYIRILRRYLAESKVGLLIVATGKSIAEEYAHMALRLCNNKLKIDYINFYEDMRLDDCLEAICYKVTQLDKGAGVVILSDVFILKSCDSYIHKETNIETKFIFALNYLILEKIIEECDNKFKSLETIGESINKFNFVTDIKKDNSLFIDKLKNSFLKQSCSFLDVDKAFLCLNYVLNNILSSLKITYNEQIAVKFYSHCCHMLERVISKNTLSFPKLRKYILDNKKIFTIVDLNFQYVNKYYGVTIGQDELAYIVEMINDL